MLFGQARVNEAIVVTLEQFRKELDVYLRTISDLNKNQKLLLECIQMIEARVRVLEGRNDKPVKPTVLQ